MRYLTTLLIFALGIITYGQNRQFSTQDTPIDFEKLSIERVASSSLVQWKQAGPGNGGYSHLMQYHPNLPGVVVLVPDMWVAYQSENDGKSWKSIKDYDGNGGDFTHLRDLRFSAVEDSFAITIEGSRLWISNNLARSWKQVKNCPWYEKSNDGYEKSSSPKVSSIGCDAFNANIFYIGGGAHVRGQHWLSCMADANAKNPYGRRNKYEGKIWKTTDKGQSFQLINNGIDSLAQFVRIISHPTKRDHIYAASQRGIFYTKNGGKNWTNITKDKVDNNVIMDMDYYYDKIKDKFILYAIDQTDYLPNGGTHISNGGIYYSEDEGKSWHKMNGNLALDINRLSSNVPDSYRKYVAKWYGMSVTDFTKKYPKLPTAVTQRFNLINADPTREGAVFIGFNAPHDYGFTFEPGRIWATENQGKTWINTARLAEDAWVRDKEYWEERENPYHENMTFGHQEQGRKKYDCAIQYGGVYARRSVQGMTISSEGHIMITSVHNTLISTDNGKSWKQVDEDYTSNGNIMGRGNSNMPGETIMQDKRLGYTIFGAGEHSIWISTNDGSQGRQALKYIDQVQNTVTAIATNPFDEKIVYSTSFREHNKEFIYRSKDGGHNWEKYGRTTPISSKVWGEDMRTMSLTVNPIDSSIIYFGVGSYANFGALAEKHLKTFDGKSSFYRSNNGGRTFECYNQGIPRNARVRRILLDPRDTERKSLFAAVAYENVLAPKTSGGLFYSKNHGENWTPVNIPASVQGVYDMAFDHSNRLYITTGHRRGGDGVWYTDDFGKNWTKIFHDKNTASISISPFDRNYIAVNMYSGAKNPGVYISKDRGATWYKINNRLAMPQTLREVQFDVNDASKMLLASCGTGYYFGDIKDGDKIQVVDIKENSVKCKSKEELRLKAKIVRREFRKETISWKSDNPAIVKVDNKGNITTIKKGVANIWATAADGRYSDCCIVVVKE